MLWDDDVPIERRWGSSGLCTEASLWADKPDSLLSDLGTSECVLSEAVSGAWDSWVPEGCCEFAVGPLALSRALLTKALALDAAVGGGAAAGCPDVEASSEGMEALLLTLACRHVYTTSGQLLPGFVVLAPSPMPNQWGGREESPGM